MLLLVRVMCAVGKYCSNRCGVRKNECCLNSMRRTFLWQSVIS